MRETHVKNILIGLGIIVMVVLCLVPFVYMMIVSVSERPDFLAHEMFTVTPRHYSAIVSVRSLHFLDYLYNSILISLISATFCVFIASLAAYSFLYLNLPGKVFILFLTLAVAMFPQISLVEYLFKFMTACGWINTYQALILPYIAWTLPLSVWILISYFAQIPRALHKAALVDGCTSWQILWHVIIPVGKIGMFSVFLISFIVALNEFMFALMLTVDHKARTIPVGIALFQGLHGEIPWGHIMAASALTTVPIVIVAIIFQRYIIGGLTLAHISQK